MRYRHSRQQRGITLLEVMATMAVMLLGVSAAMLVVNQTSQSNRRTLTATQAQLIAEQELENIASRGCTVDPPCANLAALDNTNYRVWQTSMGELRRAPPPAALEAREYEVVIDVDSRVLATSIEAGSVGSPPVSRDLIPGTAGSGGNVANVRVSVSWVERNSTERQVVVLQTRMAP
ncbi:type IV pilus modification PilV family protein [Pyxidicoccus xibeiensis]|uniref:type IV pilus modification PilV family protein n=1 Tax=Pyxidicoccus xibeiensis TaxID=2906759 RepID=UPI0020A7EBD8|nr:prepilin-type N-terminal cleavage/methylation domain-containing protein [Pyxidicoccus xibeiensis]MCP3136546.1 prepilin-type N-terminal cleavage/methylation domain-containing protein [Pyxidicoccus xibeiensis]